MSKFVKLKIENRDFEQIQRAFTVAICLLNERTPKRKQGNESDYTKDKRKQELDMAQKLSESHCRIIENMKEIEFFEE